MSNPISQIDPERPATLKPPAEPKTEKKRREVRCAMCGGTMLVDEDMYEFAREGIEAGLDNPFKCETCEQEYDMLSYEG